MAAIKITVSGDLKQCRLAGISQLSGEPTASIFRREKPSTPKMKAAILRNVGICYFIRCQPIRQYYLPTQHIPSNENVCGTNYDSSLTSRTSQIRHSKTWHHPLPGKSTV
jgi:hypothetical protein